MVSRLPEVHTLSQLKTQFAQATLAFMEDLFAKLALHSVQLIGKAAFGTASSIAIKQVSNYINNQKTQNTNVRKLQSLQDKFEAKIAIIGPMIDLIEIIAARGNSALESVVTLSTRLRRDIDVLSQKIANLCSGEATPVSRGNKQDETKIEDELREIIEKIEDIVPYLNLALTASGANITAGLPHTISPGRLMQASSALADAERRHLLDARSRHLIGSSFQLRVYTLFTSSARKKHLADFTWKEEYDKCNVSVERMPGPEAHAYELVLLEDINDGRYHEELEGKKVVEGKIVAGRRQVIDVSDIQRMYYSSSGKLLNIGDGRSPVLVLKIVRGSGRKREPGPSGPPSTPDRRESSEWLAFEIHQDDDESNGGDDDDDDDNGDEDESKSDDNKEEKISTKEGEDDDDGDDKSDQLIPKTSLSRFSSVNLSTLSLLEYILRLGALEVCEQTSHLNIADEKINLFLRDSDIAKGAIATAAATAVQYHALLNRSEGSGLASSTRSSQHFVASETASPLAGRQGTSTPLKEKSLGSASNTGGGKDRPLARRLFDAGDSSK